MNPLEELSQALGSLNETISFFETQVDADVARSEYLMNAAIAEPLPALFHMGRANVNAQKMLLLKLTQIEGRLRLVERQLLELRADFASGDGP